MTQVQNQNIVYPAPVFTHRAPSQLAKPHQTPNELLEREAHLLVVIQAIRQNPWL